MPNIQRQLRRRLTNIGVPPDVAADLSKRVQTQIEHRGPLGAADYFKRVGDGLLHYLYNTPSKQAWVHTRDRFPTFLDGLQDLPEDTLMRIAKFARVVVLGSVHKRQVTKVRDAALRPYEGSVNGLARMSKLVSLGLRSYPRIVSELMAPDPVGRHFRNTQSLSGPTETTGKPPLRKSIEILRRVPQLRNLPGVESLLYPIHPRIIAQLLDPSLCDDSDHPVGTINASQEGGCKLRMFASPYTVVQLCLYPIHYWFADRLKLLRTNCTYDQDSGATFAQQNLQLGRTVHSVDLSTATCRFPLSVQLELCEKLGLPPVYIEALKWACTGNWVVSRDLQVPFGVNQLHWEVGQPLGIAPSMSMFAFTHNMLLKGICLEIGVDPDDTFRVLGDDVVIVDDAVHAMYTEIVEECGIPISWNKSHSSDTFAEFAGYQISRTAMVRPGQWRPATLLNALGIAKSLGVWLDGEIPKRYQDAQKLYLFQEGLYNPPPEEWPTWLRINSMLIIAKLDGWKTIRAPLWWDRVCVEYKEQLVPFINPSDVRFVYSEADVAKVTFSPFGDYLKLPLIQSYLGMCRVVDREHISQIAMYAFCACVHAFELGLIPQSDTVLLLDSIASAASSVLYLPPVGRWRKAKLRIEELSRALSA